jgi:hypothetical protein
VTVRCLLPIAASTTSKTSDSTGSNNPPSRQQVRTSRETSVEGCQRFFLYIIWGRPLYARLDYAMVNSWRVDMAVLCRKRGLPQSTAAIIIGGFLRKGLNDPPFLKTSHQSCDTETFHFAAQSRGQRDY